MATETTVKSHCNIDLINVLERNDNAKLSAKDVFIIVVPAIIHLDMNVNQTSGLFKLVQGFTSNDRKSLKQLSRNSISEVARREWLPLISENELQRIIPETVRVIQEFDENGNIILNPKFLESFKKLRNSENFKANSINYGSKEYAFDLQEAIAPYIEWYKTECIWNYLSSRENYKWLLIRNFHKNYHPEVENERFGDMLKYSLAIYPQKKEYYQNLFDGMVPAHALYEKYARLFPMRMRDALYILLDNNELSFDTKFNQFKDRIISMHDDYNKMHGKNDNCSAKATHNICALLAFAHPEKYYLYKNGTFKNFITQIGIDNPINYKLGGATELLNYFSFCNRIREILKLDADIVALARKSHESIIDTDFHLMAQDFIYAIGYHLASKEYQESEEHHSFVKGSGFDLDPRYEVDKK